MRFFISFMLALSFISCGYKPLSQVSKNILGDRIYAHVNISIKDPQNAVLIQDAVNEALVSRLGESLVANEIAETIMNISIKSVDFRPINYDKNGYVIAYKTKVTLAVDTRYKDDKKYYYDATGEYDFPIEANSVISDTKRFQAIKNSSLQALDDYIVNISMKGYEYDNK